MDPKKVAAIDEMELPTDLTKLRSFLGATSHYRKFIKDYAKIAHPLTELTKHGHNFQADIGSAECKTAFQQLKDCLKTEVILAHPNLDEQ